MKEYAVRSTRRLGLASAAAAVATLAAACSNSGSSTTTKSDPASEAPTSSSAAIDAASYLTPPTALPVTTPVSKAIPTGYKIIFIQGPYPQADTIYKGMSAAAAVLGWSVKHVVYDPTNPATITTSIESAIAERPNAIVLNGVQYEQFSTEIPKATAAHVPLFPTIVPATTVAKAQNGVYPVLNADIENGHAGEILGATLAADAAKTGKTAHVLQLTVPVVKVALEPEDNGVKSELSARCPDCTRDLLNINLPDVFNGKYTQQVVSYLQSHPNVNYVVSDSGQLEDGLGAALQQAGLANVKRYGLSATNVQINELQSGQPGAWTVQPYQVYGWIIIDRIARVALGDTTDPWADEHMGYVVTAANVKGIDPNDPEFPAGYQHQFMKLWNK